MTFKLIKYYQFFLSNPKYVFINGTRKKGLKTWFSKVWLIIAMSYDNNIVFLFLVYINNISKITDV